MHDATGRDTTRYPNAAHEAARTGLKNRSRAKSARSWIVTVAILLTIVIAGSTIFAGDQDDAQAQTQSPPLLSAVIYDGWVTVGSDPLGLTGLTLSAKVGEWVSESVTIGEGTPDLNGFKDLTIEPPRELLGGQITFLLGGTVEATNTDYYAIILDDGSVCTTCEITFPIFREINLDFPSRPTGAPVSPQPSATTPEQPASGDPTVTLYQRSSFHYCGIGSRRVSNLRGRRQQGAN